MERANILKNATNKIGLAKKILEENYTEENSHWIIYCQSDVQLTNVENEIYTISKQKNFEIFRFLDKDFLNWKEKKETLKSFSNMGGVILSCKMLDEGLNIPAVSSGLLLASSTTQKEFIQRRGRILRKDNRYRFDRKKISYIFDTIILPNPSNLDKSAKNILKKEFDRAIIFSNNAENKDACNDTFNQKLIDMNLLNEV